MWRPHHREQLGGLVHRIDAKEEGAVDREDRGHQPKAECNGRDDSQSGERSAAERPERVGDVAHHGIDECDAARVATLVSGQGDRAETEDRPRTRLGGGQAAGELFQRFASDVKCQLLVELAFDAPRSHQRPHAQEYIGKFHNPRPASSRDR
jgi:hypothetical protein